MDVGWVDEMDGLDSTVEVRLSRYVRSAATDARCPSLSALLTACCLIANRMYGVCWTEVRSTLPSLRSAVVSAFGLLWQWS
jgi:hypothetical protein